VIARRGHHHHGKGTSARTITPSHSSAFRAVGSRRWSGRRLGSVEDEFMGISFSEADGLGVVRRQACSFRPRIAPGEHPGVSPWLPTCWADARGLYAAVERVLRPIVAAEERRAGAHLVRAGRAVQARDGVNGEPGASSVSRAT
jgi:hypothetical protein